MAPLIVLLVFGFTFITVVMAVFIAGQILENRRTGAGQLLNEPTDGPASVLKNEQLSSISLWHSLLARFDFVHIMRTQISQAGLNWSVGRLTLSMLLSGATTYAVISTLGWIPLWANIAVTWVAAIGPYTYALRLRSRRFREFTEELPDALDSMSRAMRSGYPLAAVLDSVAREITGPVAVEFRKTHTELKLGVSVPQALENLSDRMPVPEVDLFVAAVQLHSRTGGRLTDVLTVLAENMREQTALQGEVRAIAAQGKVTGIVLTLLPVLIGLMMAVVSPVYIGALLAHPYGKHMIAAAVLLLVVAHVIIRRIVDIRI